MIDCDVNIVVDVVHVFVLCHWSTNRSVRSNHCRVVVRIPYVGDDRFDVILVFLSFHLYIQMKKTHTVKYLTKVNAIRELRELKRLWWFINDELWHIDLTIRQRRKTKNKNTMNRLFELWSRITQRKHKHQKFLLITSVSYMVFVTILILMWF